jgi:hypothetical protein
LIRREPNNDWPLGLWDHRTVDPENDLIDNDVVFNEGGTKNTLLYFNPNQQWSWKSNMDMDDLIAFRNASSEGREDPRMFFRFWKKNILQSVQTNRVQVLSMARLKSLTTEIWGGIS